MTNNIVIQPENIRNPDEKGFRETYFIEEILTETMTIDTLVDEFLTIYGGNVEIEFKKVPKKEIPLCLVNIIDGPSALQETPISLQAPVAAVISDFVIGAYQWNADKEKIRISGSKTLGEVITSYNVRVIVYVLKRKESGYF